jgi:hypothetical protein
LDDAQGDTLTEQARMAIQLLYTPMFTFDPLLPHLISYHTPAGIFEDYFKEDADKQICNFLGCARFLIGKRHG